MRSVLDLIPEKFAQAFFGYTLTAPDFSLSIKQVEESKEGYGDPLFDSLLVSILPEIESAYGKPLAPTYSFYRVYKEGQELPAHLDREACQVSVSICLGYNFSYLWPIYISGEPFALRAGQGVIYKGCEEIHWRDPLRRPPKDMDNGSEMFHSQLFLHYIEKDGPFYPEHLFDGRNVKQI